MNFDYFTTAALAAELRKKLVGGRLQDILEIDDLALGLEIYHQQQRHYLYLSADPANARAHLTAGKLRRGVAAPSPLGLLLNRYVHGARLVNVWQPPWERILILDFSSADGDYSLVLEPIERRSNIVLVEDGVIMECIRRVGADENRVRQLLPGKPYQLPPLQQKIAPDALSLDNLKKLLDQDSATKAHSALTRGIHGLSPVLAREIVFRAMGKANLNVGDASPREIYSVVPEVLDPLLDEDFSPGITVEDGVVTSFAAYPISYRAGWQPTPSISEAIERYYGAVSGEEAYEASKSPIRKQVADARRRLKGKLFSLERQLQDEAKQELLRQSGELLLAYQYQLKRGDTHFSAQYDPDAEPLAIPLDPTLTPVENAQRYFARYEKAKRSRQAVPLLVAATQAELDYLEQLETDLDIASNWTEIGEIQNTLQEEGYWRGSRLRQAAGKSAPRKITTDDGTLIWIGRNARQNEEVTFNKGAAEDIWLHARGVPGSHVIVKSYGRPPSPQAIHQAAAYAAYYSKGRSAGKVDVIVTERRYVRKLKGGKPGMVRVMQQSHPTLTVSPQPAPDEA